MRRIFLPLFVLLYASSSLAQEEDPQVVASPDSTLKLKIDSTQLHFADPKDVESPESIVHALYDIISTPAGEIPNWSRWNTLFIPEARLIALGSNNEGEDGYNTWTPDEYKEQVGGYLEENPFFEIEASHTSEQFGNMVHRFSTYESYRSMAEPPFSRGINSIQLLYMEDRWWIVTILWQSENERFPLPEKYLPEE